MKFDSRKVRMKQTPKKSPIGCVKKPFSGEGVKMDHPWNKGRKKVPIGSVKRPVTVGGVMRPAWYYLWDEEYEKTLIEMAINHTMKEQIEKNGLAVMSATWGNLDEAEKWMKEAIMQALEEREANRETLRKFEEETAEIEKNGKCMVRPAMDHPRNKGGRKKPFWIQKRPVMGVVVLWPTWDNWNEACEIKWLKEALKQAVEEREAQREKQRRKRRKYEEKRAERKKNGEEKEIEAQIYSGRKCN